MCKHCENVSILLEKDEVISNLSFGWGDDETKINRSQCVDYTIAIVLDRGYLRLVDKEDYGCLDHGEKIKINYCPMCGNKLGL